MRLFLAALTLVMATTPAGAQWLDRKTPGIPRTSDGKPNLTAPAPRGLDGKPDLTGIWNGPFAAPRLDPANAQPWPVTKGTLIVNISDAKTKNGLWRGTATQTLDNGPTGDRLRDAKTVEKPIRKAVEKMFKKFPPQSKQ